MGARPLSILASITLLAMAVPASAQNSMPAHALATVPLSDPELAQVTGKFVLPNGVELALSVISDTALNGQLILRTVLTVDHDRQLQVFGRTPGAVAVPSSPAGATSVGVAASGITVAFDRQSGIGSVTPVFSVTQAAAPTVSVGSASQTIAPPGLGALALAPGGAAVVTPDGSVTLQSVRNGSQVTLIGDQLAVTNLVGQSIASAVVNAANNRTLDTVTTVSLDLRNAAPYQIGSALLRVDTLVTEASRGLAR